MLLLPATVTSREARDTLRMLAQALQREPGTEVVINAGGLQQFDSAALAVLLECSRLARAWGKGFAVRQAPPKLVALAQLYGIAALLLDGAAGAAPAAADAVDVDATASRTSAGPTGTY